MLWTMATINHNLPVTKFIKSQKKEKAFNILSKLINRELERKAIT